MRRGVTGRKGVVGVGPRTGTRPLSRGNHGWGRSVPLLEDCKTCTKLTRRVPSDLGAPVEAPADTTPAVSTADLRVWAEGRGGDVPRSRRRSS